MTAIDDQDRRHDRRVLRSDSRDIEYADRNPQVIAEITADQFPTGEFELLAGVKDTAHLLEGLPIDLVALPEGTLFDGWTSVPD